MSPGRQGAPGPLPVSPYLRDLPPYPFARLDELRARVEARGVRVIDLGMGDPREPTPEFVKQALRNAIPERSTYPRAVGIAALREAASGWTARRFGVEVDPDREILPANGSKEAIFTLPLAVLDRDARPLVLVPDPAYPVYALGTLAAGGKVERLPLRAERGFLPDLDAVPAEVWERTSILWLNYPNNPTGAAAPEAFLKDAVDRARAHGVLLVSDEAYADLYYGEPPGTALRWGTDHVLALHTLSKRSGMAGYRSGFMAGDPRLIDALKRFRPGIGVATPEFIQRAAVAAWADDDHAAVIRGRFRRRRDLVVGGLRGMGLAVDEPAGAMYVWLPVPPGFTSETFAARCLEAGVVVLPGSALGPAGEGFVRLSLVPQESELTEALVRLRGLSV
jgi:acetylornithine/N-succinyldiaminopimelate aminotransferase